MKEIISILFEGFGIAMFVITIFGLIAGMATISLGMWLYMVAGTALASAGIYYNKFKGKS